jgi:hypothetical protein
MKEKCQQSMFQKLFSQSLHHLEAGVKAFDAVRDEANLALLHSNNGRLMRMCAHFHSPDSSDRHSELAGQERHFYNKVRYGFPVLLTSICQMLSRNETLAQWENKSY